jgi:formylglycine-generating enzyme required for sulfatase activity
MKLRFFLTCLSTIILIRVAANNIQVSNASLIDNNTAAGTCMVQFDLSWENSWMLNGVVNWDAAWVFVKFKTSQGIWQHARLADTGHLMPSGSQLELGLLTPGAAYDQVSNPVVGTFIRRTNEGSGTFTAMGVKLNWNYFAQGIGSNDIAEVRVFAIEMVHVNQGAFAAGSGGAEADAFIRTTIGTADATTAPSGTGSLGGQSGGYPTSQVAPSNSAWPNGFKAFYCMKYEISQQGYVDLLNTLTYEQQQMRTVASPAAASGSAALSPGNSHRNGIDVQTAGVAGVSPAVYACNYNGNSLFGEPADGKDIACNFLGWGDVAAYLDWSGLRPMTELEFEKACRGPLLAVPNEFAWGTASVSPAIYTLANAGANNEAIATNYGTAGNALYDQYQMFSSSYGPYRVGIFAAHGSNSGRVTSGSSYYGIMELSGNTWENTITIGNASGRSFNGVHGNGSLDSNGEHDATTWPLASTGEGKGLRGGDLIGSVNSMQVSFRSYAMTANVGRQIESGGRGVRTAP